jgi:hypothetical protein
MLKTYEVKFKRFIDGKCYDNKERSTRISAPSAYQAVFQHGQTNGGHSLSKTLKILS